MPDILITGIPRSGTTLAAAILDRAPDCFCLSEPQRHVDLMLESENAAEFVDKLEHDYSAIRTRLVSGGSVCDRRYFDGVAPTNYFTDAGPFGKRAPTYTILKVDRKGLTQEFRLGVKHNALYCAVLPELAKRERFKTIIALVRHPVDVIASWQTLDLPVAYGRLPAAERFWTEMRVITHSDIPILDKQLLIYDLLCERFLSLSGRVELVQYERMVEAPLSILRLAGINDAGISLDVSITPRTRTHSEKIEKRRKYLVQSGRLRSMEILYPVNEEADGNATSDRMN